MGRLPTLAVLLMAMLLQATTLHLNEVADGPSDETVKELKSLKNNFGKEENPNRRNNDEDFSVSETRTSVLSDVNGDKTSYEEITSEVNRNGKLIAKVDQKAGFVKSRRGKFDSTTETEVEVPPLDIHQVLLKNAANTKKRTRNSESKGNENEVGKIDNVSTVTYNPRYMAEYIFWTGDEKNVASTVEEFLEEGLMSRQEAINFLQSLKIYLDFLESHYQNLKKIGKKISRERKTKLKLKLLNLEPKVTDGRSENAKLGARDFPKPKPDSPETVLAAADVQQHTFPMRVENEKFREGGVSEHKNKSDYGPRLISKGSGEVVGVLDDYEDVTEKPKVPDLSFEESALEDLIFQLVGELFSKSVPNENKEAQTLLKSFFIFLLSKAEEGEISKNLKKKILGVLVTGLVETLSDHPELVNQAKNELYTLKGQNTSIPAILKKFFFTLGSEEGNPGPS